MRQEAQEVGWIAKVVVWLAASGAWLGAWAWAAWLSYTSGGWKDWGVTEWIKWPWALYKTGFGSELAIAAAVGAVVFASPIYFLLRRRPSGRVI